MRETEVKDRYVEGKDGYCKFINRYGLRRTGLEEPGSLICQYCTRQGIGCGPSIDTKDVIGTVEEIDSGYL